MQQSIRHQSQTSEQDEERAPTARVAQQNGPLVRHRQSARRITDVIELAATFIGKNCLHARGHICQSVERFAFRSRGDGEHGVARLLAGIPFRHEVGLRAAGSSRVLKGPDHPYIILLGRGAQGCVGRHLGGRARSDEVLRQPRDHCEQ